MVSSLPSSPSLASPSASRTPHVITTLPPELGGYLIDGILGRGGNGIVLRASCERSGRSVAIKWIAGPLPEGHQVRRFRRGAELAALLRHPAIVDVLGSGETDDGGLYLTMELLEGEDLDTRLRRGALPVPAAVELAIRAAEALEFAHGAGVLHRDVKPANLFLCRDGRVKVLDFGVGLMADAGESTRLTGPRALVGTPGYMAVEQARGTRDEDARTDVWGLAATLYHLLAGRPPFEAPSALAQLVRAVTDEPDPMPPHVPVWLQAVVLRALRKSASDRWPTMAAFRDALQNGERPSFPLPPTLEIDDEVRVVAVLVAQGVGSASAFEEAVAREGGDGPFRIGSDAIAVFGGQAWRGDEAVRAVRAGLAIRERDASCRLGVATGRAVRASAGVTGAAVAAAQGALSAIGVGVDPETHRRVRGGFDLEPGRVLRRRPGLTVVGLRELGAAEVPMFGRDREIADLAMTLRQVVDESQAAGVLVLGVPGIGKSRLVHELQLHVEELPYSVYDLEGRGQHHRRLQPWHALAHALRLRAEIPEGTLPAEAQHRLLALCPTRTCAELLGEILGAEFPESPALAAIRRDPALRFDRTLVALGDLFEALTARHPVVLVMEDLQWADGASLAALEVLLRRLERRPFLCVGTARPDVEVPPLPDFRRLGLVGLSRVAIRRIVEGILTADGRSPDAADRIHERCEGNPFFAEELALAWRQGVTDLPSSVEAATQARLDALPAEEKDLLRRASVFGRRFWTEALESMGIDKPAELLARLRRRELVAAEPCPRLAGANEWRFRHALVQEVAYGSLTPSHRVSLHRQAGDWLAGRSDAPPIEVVRHLEAEGDDLGAADHWADAAERAYRGGDAAQVLATSALALRRIEGAAFLSRQRQAFRLRSMRAEAVAALGLVHDEAMEIDALELVAVSPAEQAEVWARRAVSRSFQGTSTLESPASIDRSLIEIESALVVATEAADPRLRLLVLDALAAVLCRASRTEEAFGVLQEAARMADVLEVPFGSVVRARRDRMRALLGQPSGGMSSHH